MAWSLGSTPKISSESSTSAPVSLPLVLMIIRYEGLPKDPTNSLMFGAADGMSSYTSNAIQKLAINEATIFMPIIILFGSFTNGFTILRTPRVQNVPGGCGDV